MENSLNSSSSETSVSDVRAVFKKPANITRAFEVSLDESVPAVASNKSDLNATESESGSQGKVVHFERKRKSIEQYFNVVDSRESINASEFEDSVTFAKPRPVLRKKNRDKTLNEYFNVSYNDTDTSVQPGEINMDDSNTVYNKEKPFTKINKNQEEILVGDETLMQVVNESGVEEFEKLDDEHDSTTLVTKQNPFKKQQNDSESQLQSSVTEGNKSPERETDKESMTGNDFRLSDETDSTTVKSKCNPFKLGNTPQTKGSICVSAERRNESLGKAAVEPDQNSENITAVRSISKSTNNSISYLEQSSINDENLNNWMSDVSEEEVPPPGTPPHQTGNLSHTAAEKLPVLGSPTMTNPNPNPNPNLNPVSVWEQKINEMVLNAERKTAKRRDKLETPSKKKRFKKAKVALEGGDEENRVKGRDAEKHKPIRLAKPAPFATKQLYEHLIKKLKPKYGIDATMESEKLVWSICETVKKVTRRKSHQKKLIQDLKKEMAEAGAIETTWDFYEFVIKFLPYGFRVKVVPCVQPVTNTVYPPKDVTDPFERIFRCRLRGDSLICGRRKEPEEFVAFVADC